MYLFSFAWIFFLICPSGLNSFVSLCRALPYIEFTTCLKGFSVYASTRQTVIANINVPHSGWKLRQRHNSVVS